MIGLKLGDVAKFGNFDAVFPVVSRRLSAWYRDSSILAAGFNVEGFLCLFCIFFAACQGINAPPSNLRLLTPIRAPPTSEYDAISPNLFHQTSAYAAKPLPVDAVTLGENCHPVAGDPRIRQQ